MTNDKGILIQNIYYMLSYAFQVLKQNNYDEVETESFENVFDMLAAILNKGISQQLKQGLYREYINQNENLSVLRGKIGVNGTIKNRLKHSMTLSCEYDELLENNLMNQIIKTTALVLMKQKCVSDSQKKALRKNLMFFNEVEEITTDHINWSQICFQRNNQSYKMLLNICYLVLDSLLLSTESGEQKLPSFLDEQKMCRLYEKFILEYYRFHHPKLHANPVQIPWNLDDGMIEFLPIMQTDITLKYKGRTLIIDAKYYAHTMQSQYDVNTLHSGNLYQIYTYVKNMDKDGTGDVSGMLLYAKTQEQVTPNNDFSMGGNQISVKTLDLSLKFDYISKQLEEYANKVMMEEE